MCFYHFVYFYFAHPSDYPVIMYKGISLVTADQKPQATGTRQTRNYRLSEIISRLFLEAVLMELRV